MAETIIKKDQGGVPPGGSTGQVLTKNSNTDYDDSWQASGAGGGTSGGTMIIPGFAGFPLLNQTSPQFLRGDLIGCDMSQASPTYLWYATCGNGGGMFVYRLDKQSNGNYMYKGVSVAVNLSTSQTLLGITEMGGKVYIWYNNPNIVSPTILIQYTTSLTSPVSITGFSNSQSTLDFATMTSDTSASGKLWITESNSVVKSYTISGSAATLVDNITLGGGTVGVTPILLVDTSGNLFITSITGSNVNEFNNSGVFQSSLSIGLYVTSPGVAQLTGFLKLGSGFAIAANQLIGLKASNSYSSQMIINGVDLP